MEEYQEIKLNKFREVVVFSFFFLSFFSGRFFITDEFCGWIRIKQQKTKYRTKWFDSGLTFQEYWSEWKYKWRKI